MRLNNTVITLVVLLIGADAQLSFRTDPQSNSFTVQTPSFQQTFSRFYGTNQGQSVGGTLEAAQTQQIQQVLPAPQTQGFPTTVPQSQNQPQYTTTYSSYPTQPAGIQFDPATNQFIVNNQNQPTQEYQPQLQQPQPQQQSADLAAYFQQLQQVQPQLAASRFQVPSGNNQFPTVLNNGQQQQQFINPQQQQQQQLQQQPQQYHQLQQPQQLQLQQNPQPNADQQSPQQLLGVAFSPSSEVSSVKFSSGSLNYKF